MGWYKIIPAHQKAAPNRFLMYFFSCLLITCITFFARCKHPPGPDADPRGDLYAGTAACISCHQDISNSWLHNNHYRTSAATHPGKLKKGAVSSGTTFYFADSSYIRIDTLERAIFQSYFADGGPGVSEKMDCSFGSGEKARTYGYWKEDKLYQLPLTWFAKTNSWANSPGFPATHARFGRVITSRCFECHASYIKKESVQTGSLSVSEKLDRNSIVYGIDCERCHGPALEHANFHRQNPSLRTARHITRISALSRQQQLDICAVCHSGNDQAADRSLFAFVPGDTLSQFYFPDFGSPGAEPDVHGKQIQLLASSKCFRNSNMTCATCHHTHGDEGHGLTGFVSTCMGCHQNSTHAKKNLAIATNNCIDCHMPLQTSKIITFNNGAGLQNIPYLIRTHRIAIYK